MKNFLIAVLLITFISIGYVCQQTKLLETSYAMHSGSKNLRLLIDQNKNLRYNIAKLEAPARLEEAVFVKNDLDHPYASVDCYKIKVARDLPNARDAMVPPGPFIKAGNAFMSMFALSSEAVADDLVSN